MSPGSPRLPEPPAIRTPIDALLEEQQDLTAVARFAAWQTAHAESSPRAAYRHLLPFDRPRPGQQYAFDVALDQCSGCKACVSACHTLNGLDDGEAWREVGLLVSDDWRRPYQQTVTTACHHCVDPACLNGCPVLAYDKDPVTGIVRHLDDQCIGCQYCVLKCPYDAPKYSNRRGIVRKCDLCSHRLAAGEAPACVQACPSEAIRITVVDTAAVTAQFRAYGTPTNSFLPASPSSDYTLPTTRYRAGLDMPRSLRAADSEALRAEPAHFSLVFMLLFSQLAVGLFLVGAILGPFTSAVLPQQTLLASVVALLALLGSLAHLGQPRGAWRAFLGLRKSWLSREIVVFGGWLALAAWDTASTWGTGLGAPGSRVGLELATVAVGLLGVFCSAMVYHDTQREFWRWPQTLGKFLGTTLVLGAAGTLVLRSGLSPRVASAGISTLAAITALSMLFKLGLEHRVLRHAEDEDFSPLHKTALLQLGRFGLIGRCRVACGLAGAVIGPGLIALQMARPVPHPLSVGALTLQAVVLFGLCLLGEGLERYLFFTTVQPRRMPGVVTA